MMSLNIMISIITGCLAGVIIFLIILSSRYYKLATEIKDLKIEINKIRAAADTDHSIIHALSMDVGDISRKIDRYIEKEKELNKSLSKSSDTVLELMKGAVERFDTDYVETRKLYESLVDRVETLSDDVKRLELDLATCKTTHANVDDGR